MKKIFVVSIFVFTIMSNTFAWQYVQGTVKRVWVNGFASKPDVIIL